MKDTHFKARYDWTLIDPVIKQIYESGKRGVIKAVMRKYDIPATTIRYRARKLGLNSMIYQGRESPRRYCAKEKEILIRNHDRPVSIILQQLNEAGFKRSAKSVANYLTLLRKETRIPSLQEHRDTINIMTTCEISELMGVSSNNILRKIKEGLLYATEQEVDKEGARTRRFLIRRKDLRNFLINYPAHWDHRKCNQFFLIDILSSGQLPTHIQHSAGVKEAGMYRDAA